MTDRLLRWKHNHGLGLVFENATILWDHDLLFLVEFLAHAFGLSGEMIWCGYTQCTIVPCTSRTQNGSISIVNCILMTVHDNAFIVRV